MEKKTYPEADLSIALGLFDYVPNPQLVLSRAHQACKYSVTSWCRPNLRNFLRKINYYDVSKSFFLPFLKLIQSNFKKQLFKIALYYPSNYELNVLKLFEFNKILIQDTLLPVIDKNNLMTFFPW